MKINKKRLIQVSLCMILAGALLTGVGILLGGRPGVAFTRNGPSSPYRHKKPYIMEKTKIDSFSDVDLQINSYADIRICSSEDKNFYLEYRLDGDYGKPSWNVSKNTLTLTHKDTSLGGIYFFNINFGSSFSEVAESSAYITLYVPVSEGKDMGQLNIYNDSGNVSVEDLTFKDAALDVDYGNVNLQNLNFQRLNTDVESGSFHADSLSAPDFFLKAQYGDVTLKEVSSENAELKLESGKLEAVDFTCDSLTAKNEYGDIELKGFSSKAATLTLDSGNLYLDADTLGNLTCKNEYGNVELLLPEELSLYSIDAGCEYGSIELPPDFAEGYHISSDEETVYKADGHSDNRLIIDVESGDIKIADKANR